MYAYGNGNGWDKDTHDWAKGGDGWDTIDARQNLNVPQKVGFRQPSPPASCSLAEGVTTGRSADREACRGRSEAARHELG